MANKPMSKLQLAIDNNRRSYLARLEAERASRE